VSSPSWVKVRARCWRTVQSCLSLFTAYYQLADIFIDSLRRRSLDRIFPSGEVSYSGIGAFTNEDEQRRTVVTGVVEDTPAHQAGLLIGDEILG
jgi:carboxyl-terminal processing protease